MEKRRAKIKVIWWLIGAIVIGWLVVVEAGRRKVAYTHTSEAYNLDGNHVASVICFLAGNWKEG